MGQRTDGDQVGAGLGDCANSVERHAAGNFELNFRSRERARLANIVERHVVEQDRVGAGFKCFLNLREGLAFDFDFERMRRDSTGTLDRFRHGAGSRDMVFLDQHAAVETKAMVMPAADADRVLFDDAQAGMRLAGVDNLGVSSRDRIDERARRGRDSGEELHKVERGAFADEQSRELAFDFCEHTAGFQLGAFGRECSHSRLGPRLSHHRFDEYTASENHPRFFDGDPRAAHRPGCNSRRSGDIALPHILGERAFDEIGGIELLEEFHDYSGTPACAAVAPWLGVHRPASRKIRGPSAALGMTQKSDDASSRFIFV